MMTLQPYGLIAFVATSLVGSLIAQGDGGPAESGLRVREDLEVRRYSVDTLVAPYRGVWLQPLGRVFYGRVWTGADVELNAFDDPELSANRVLPGRANDRGPCSPDTLLSLIKAVSPGAVWRSAGAVLDVDGETLLAVQQASRLAKLQGALGAITGAIAPRFRMTVHVVGAAGDPTERALTPDEARAIVAASPPIERTPFGAADVRVGDHVSFNAVEDRSLLVDIDVEIAQNATADDPVVTSIRVGQALTVYCTLDIDGGLAVFGYWTDREAGPVRLRSVAVENERALEHCDVALRTRAFAVRLGQHGGHLVRLGNDRFAVILAERLDPAGTIEDGALLPIGLLLDAVATGGEEGVAGIHGQASSPDQLMALVDAVTANDAKTPIASVEAGPTLLVRGAQHVDAAKRVLAFEGARFHRRFVVAIAREVLRNDAWIAAGAPVSVACLGERIGVAVEGTERLIVADYDVEVATEARTTDPIVKACFDGMHAAFRVLPSPSGCTLDLSLLDRSMREPRTRSGPIRGAAALDLVDVQHASIVRRVALPLGEWRVLGRGVDVRVDNVRTPSRLKVRVTELK